ncbi:hypothetical protein SacmaDRAFT_4364 [Saccharomonospora marina XMU15]|uniref:PE domain-containing protein n=1 Tax=Saccharomonospora marina XMU15 TaxID=882083 RepID=H5X8X5_9PSEU|nr:hypothetical protein [Saccharomonospora marina]EHR52550.1 hypothetical protein SacmaDRAFT_4364 [Saccharomonospora marina XMU15]
MADGVPSGERSVAVDVFAGSSSAVAAVQGVFGPAGAVVGAAGVGVAMAGAAAGSVSGSWTFDREQIDSVIRKWEDVRDSCREDRQLINAAVSSVFTPSEDEPSGKYATEVVDGLLALQESNQSMLAYIEDFLERLVKARDGIEQADSASADLLRSVKGA